MKIRRLRKKCIALQLAVTFCKGTADSNPRKLVPQLTMFRPHYNCSRETEIFSFENIPVHLISSNFREFVINDIKYS